MLTKEQIMAMATAGKPAQGDIGLMNIGRGGTPDPKLSPVLEDGKMPVKNIGEKEISKATEVLNKYKAGKTSLEKRIVENEKWYKMQHWQYMRTKYNNNAADGDRMEPASAWLFNSIFNKHADAMDNFPEPNVLPRERGDEADAQTLSSIIPVVFERGRFKKCYSDNWWYKLKTGTAPYGAFWDTAAENGLGDISVKRLDLLNLFWEPGITDIQDSPNFYIVDLVNTEQLKEKYPELKDGAKTIDIAQYKYDDDVDITDKSVVVDWYYKKNVNNNKVLHYVKYVGNTVLYASENDPELAVRGWYDHGMYPVVFDVLFPEEGTPFGFGYVDLCKDPQTYIDKLNQCIAENVSRTSRARYLYKEGAGVNVDDFRDLSKDLIPATGNLDGNFKMIEDSPLPTNALNFLNYKVDELKETSGNRDVNQGSSAGGVTAAAAISALQEAGNKLSRDMLQTSYENYTQINYLVIELIRQFYDVARTFRIKGDGDKYKYVDYSNANIKPQSLGQLSDGQEGFRKPVFDIIVKPQKANPFSRMAQNELAKELYGMGVFMPDNADQALMLLSMMEFEGKEALVERINKNKTLLEMVKQMSVQLMMANLNLYKVTGGAMGSMPTADQLALAQSLGQAQGGTQQAQGNGSGVNLGADMMAGMNGANSNATTPYGAKLAERAKVDAHDQGNV